MSDASKEGHDWLDYLDLLLQFASVAATTAIAIVGLLFTNQQEKANRTMQNEQGLESSRQYALELLFKVEALTVSPDPKERQIGFDMVRMMRQPSFVKSFNPRLGDDPDYSAIINAVGNGLLSSQVTEAAAKRDVGASSWQGGWIYLGEWAGSLHGMGPRGCSGSWVTVYVDFVHSLCPGPSMAAAVGGKIPQATGDVFVRDNIPSQGQLGRIIDTLRVGETIIVDRVAQPDRALPYIWGHVAIKPDRLDPLVIEQKRRARSEHSANQLGDPARPQILIRHHTVTLRTNPCSGRGESPAHLLSRCVQNHI